MFYFQFYKVIIIPNFLIYIVQGQAEYLCEAVVQWQ